MRQCSSCTNTGRSLTSTRVPDPCFALPGPSDRSGTGAAWLGSRSVTHKH